MILKAVSAAVDPHGLMVMGHTSSKVLVGTDAHWWSVFTQSAEYVDAAENPVDTWSKRVLNGIADRLGATAHFPSDGPPYAPFIAWALDTGRFWQSPTGMMIHDRAGLMISIRGALEFTHEFKDASEGSRPCDACTDRPCVTACPVGALSAETAYDVPACKAYLDTPAGVQCMTRGCHVRRACPVSQSFDRPDAQTAFHMKAFHR
ncbi:ferredoxin [uncultured Tateyamaria sp.]|uniref:ferredoxin n=1 Tax=uncultured Tateyamaria sp. TaxID=455651 RepID=UPI002608DE90|nr:ferredoxin [uncultured Tateyamaria sp.]